MTRFQLKVSEGVVSVDMGDDFRFGYRNRTGSCAELKLFLYGVTEGCESNAYELKLEVINCNKMMIVSWLQWYL